MASSILAPGSSRDENHALIVTDTPRAEAVGILEVAIAIARAAIPATAHRRMLAENESTHDPPIHPPRSDRRGTRSELSPFDPMLPVADVARALARFSDADDEAAVAYAASSLDDSPQNPPSLRLLAASLELIGDHDGAVGAVRDLLDLGPITIGWLRENLTPFGGPGTFDRYLGALARAGIPN